MADETCGLTRFQAAQLAANYTSLNLIFRRLFSEGCISFDSLHFKRSSFQEKKKMIDDLIYLMRDPEMKDSSLKIATMVIDNSIYSRNAEETDLAVNFLKRIFDYDKGMAIKFLSRLPDETRRKVIEKIGLRMQDNLLFYLRPLLLNDYQKAQRFLPLIVCILDLQIDQNPNTPDRTPWVTGLIMEAFNGSNDHLPAELLSRLSENKQDKILGKLDGATLAYLFKTLIPDLQEAKTKSAPLAYNIFNKLAADGEGEGFDRAVGLIQQLYQSDPALAGQLLLQLENPAQILQILYAINKISPNDIKKNLPFILSLAGNNELVDKICKLDDLIKGVKPEDKNKILQYFNQYFAGPATLERLRELHNEFHNLRYGLSTPDIYDLNTWEIIIPEPDLSTTQIAEEINRLPEEEIPDREIQLSEKGLEVVPENTPAYNRKHFYSKYYDEYYDALFQYPEAGEISCSTQYGEFMDQRIKITNAFHGGQPKGFTFYKSLDGLREVYFQFREDNNCE